MPEQKQKSTIGSFLGKLAMIVIGAVLAGFGSYLWTEHIRPKPIYVNIQIFDDSKPSKSLKDVAVSPGLSDVASKHTEDFGVARFEVPFKHRKEQVSPQFKFDGYSQILGQGPDKFPLDHSEIKVIYVMKKDVPPTPEYDLKVYSSGAKASGPGASFSQWYELCNDPQPPGWQIEETSFTLTGDRQCNAWSECKQVDTGDPKKVCWQFRMQGHSEQAGFFNQGNTGIQFSTGLLNVRWKKQS